MRKKAVLIYLANLLLAAAGFGMHRLSRLTGFEAETGLAIPGAFANLALMTLAAVTAAVSVIAALCIVNRYTSADAYRSAFHGGSILWVLLQLAAAALLLPVAGKALLQGLGGMGSRRLWHFAQALLAVLAVTGIAASAFGCRHPAKAGRGETAALAAAPLFFCLQLVLCYKENAADPVILHYVWQALGLAAVSLALYFTAGYAFGVVKTKRTFVGLFLGVFFCGVWMGGAGGGALLIPLSAFLLLSGYEVRFLRNLILKEETQTEQEKTE